MEHPAKFSAPVLAAVRTVLALYPINGPVLDPFAGVGGVHELRNDGYETVGLELEKEWADASPYTEQGTVLAMPSAWRERFACIVTSPPYGNRMADGYAGDSKPCPACPTHTDGLVDAWCVCKTCKGTGAVSSRRHTYRIALGHELSQGNAGALQWGDTYRAFMVKAFYAMSAVLRPGGLCLVNISDHVRDGKLQEVPTWYEKNGARLGTVLERIEIPTRRLRHGANSNLRADCEWLFVFRKDGSGSA